MKRQKHTTPLLSAVAVSMLCTSLAAGLGAHGIYQKYDTDGWAQPAVTVLMQALAHRDYPWSNPAPAVSDNFPASAPGRDDPAKSPAEFENGLGDRASANLPEGTGNGSSASLPGGTGDGSSANLPGGAGDDSANLPEGTGNGSSASLPGEPSGSSQNFPGGTTDGSSANLPEGTGGASSAEPPGSAGENGSESNGQSGPNTEAKQYAFTDVTREYFDDALLIGDSRAEGVKLYSGWDNLTYYAEGGMTVYNMFQSQVTLEDGRKCTVEEALQERNFGKIYLEIGINEMGTGTLDSFMEAYENAVARLRELQPDAIVYLCGIMYVKQSKSESDPIFNNPNILARNERIAQLADGENLFYLDINELVADETGNLNPEYTWDEIHLLGKYDVLWLDYFCSHGIVKDDVQP